MPDPEGRGAANLGWGFAWPANRRIIYNRASARPDGTPWCEEKKWVCWDPDKVNPATGEPGDVDRQRRARLRGRPRRPTRQPDPDGIGLDALSGTDPFIMKADGKGWLFTPTGLVDGPLPTHYEPIESPAPNVLYPQQRNSPVLKALGRRRQSPAPAGGPGLPLRADHLPPDRAPPLRRDEPLAALAGRAAAGAVRRDQPRTGRREGHRQHRGGAGDHARAARSPPRRSSPAACGR